jgi:hypothetical protein
MRNFKFKKQLRKIFLWIAYLSAILILVLLSTYQKEYLNLFLILFFGVCLPSYLISIILD